MSKKYIVPQDIKHEWSPSFWSRSNRDWWSRHSVIGIAKTISRCIFHMPGFSEFEYFGLFDILYRDGVCWFGCYKNVLIKETHYYIHHSCRCSYYCNIVSFFIKSVSYRLGLNINGHAMFHYIFIAWSIIIIKRIKFNVLKSNNDNLIIIWLTYIESNPLTVVLFPKDEKKLMSSQQKKEYFY